MGARPAQRPPLAELAMAIPAALLAAVPFVTAGHAGSLGVSFNNDMAGHLPLAEAYRYEAVERLSGLHPEYPLGPHALVATIADALGERSDLVFAGLTAALPILLAWTSLAALRQGPWLARTAAATIVALPFLVAGYYGQGSFKELMQALFVLAVALLLAFAPPITGRWRWAPMALLLAGSASVYSYPGFAWLVAFLGVWLVGQAVATARRGGGREIVSGIRAGIVPAVLGAGLLVLALVPQLPRIWRFYNQFGIAESDIGNLAGPLSGWQAFGVWSNPDYRFPDDPGFGPTLIIIIAVGLVLYGAIALVRRGQLMIPAAAALAMLIWWVSSERESPYVAAKALVIASPLLALVAALPLTSGPPPGPGYRFARPIVLAVLVAIIGVSSLGALRVSRVGPTDHTDQLRALRSELDGRPTLFLGNDDFIGWELAGVPVEAPYVGYQRLPIPNEKFWTYGQALDFDTVDAGTLNRVDWVITTRDAAGSVPPEQFEVARRTSDFTLWRRTGTVEPRQLLPEGDAGGGILDCSANPGRALARTPGMMAAVRPTSAGVALPPLIPGASVTVEVPLQPGAWELATPYESPMPIEVTAPGLRARLPANLDRPGPRWPIGRIQVTGTEPVPITFHAEDNWLRSDAVPAIPKSVVATPADFRLDVMPARKACGRFVDWFSARVGRSPSAQAISAGASAPGTAGKTDRRSVRPAHSAAT